MWQITRHTKKQGNVNRKQRQIHGVYVVKVPDPNFEMATGFTEIRGELKRNSGEQETG